MKMDTFTENKYGQRYPTEPKLTYALDNQSKQIVSIKDVASGKCNCICPKCQQPLIAKKGDIRNWHFAHKEDGIKREPCQGYYMSTAHQLAEQIILQTKSVMFPPRHETKAERMSFDSVEIEKANERQTFRPDVTGKTKDGQLFYIELYFTNKIDENKKREIEKCKIPCVEIDIRDVKLEELENFLLNSSEKRSWIYPRMPKTSSYIGRPENKRIEDPIDKYLATLLPNKPFIDIHGRKTEIVNYTKSHNRKFCIVKSVDVDDKSNPMPVHLTFVYYRNGKISFDHFRDYPDTNAALAAMIRAKNYAFNKLPT